MEKMKKFSFTDQVAIPSGWIEKMSRVWVFPLVMVITDYLAIVIALLSAYYIREVIMGGQTRTVLFISNTYIYLVIPAAFLFFLHYGHLYQKWLPFWQQTERIFKVSTYAMLLALLLMYASGSVALISRIFMFLAWLFTFLFLSLSRALVQLVFSKYSFLQTPVIVFGAGKTLDLLLLAFKKQQGMGYRIVGIIEDEMPKGASYQGYPILGTFDEAETVIQASGIRDVLITAPGLKREKLTSLVNKVQPLVDNVTFVPDLFGVPVQGMEVETLFHEKMVMLKVCNNLSRWYSLAVKRVFDLLMVFLFLPIILPVMAFIGLLIKLDSSGPVLYQASRLGRNGRVFCCYKFRTMHLKHNEMFEEFLNSHPAAQAEWETYAKIKGDDPRVTRIGKILRHYSLDELPQLINVVLGDMSLVGPRPYLPRERHRMKYYRQVIQYARPGITGLWQISGRNELSFDERVRLDAWYVRNWSLWLDMVFLIKTIGVVLGQKGAY